MDMKTEPKELLKWNPILFDKKRKKYIWYDRAIEERLHSAYLFAKLLQMNIYVEGFATDYEEDIDVRMYHKLIVDIRELDVSEAVVLTALEHKQPQYSICEEIKILNPEFQVNNVIIYGAGAKGDCIWRFLNKRGILVEGYIDYDISKRGQKKNGVPVYGIEKLHQMSSTDVIVEALNQYKQADDLICRQKYLENRFFYANDNKYAGSIFYEDKLLFKTFVINIMNIVFRNRNIYVYGTNAAAQEYAKKLVLLDFNFQGFLYDNEEEIEKVKQYPIKYIKDVLYDNNYYIMIEKDNKEEAIKKLEIYGLRYAVNFALVGTIVGRVEDRRHNQLDINLGHTYQGKEEKGFSGITVFGNEGRGNYKIAVLGASNTDAGIYPFKTWTEFLYEYWPGKPLTIYNAGVAGYNSAQQLFKMIRDILPLQPDMIIVYEGGNDTHINPKEPFAFEISKRVFEFADRHMKNGWKQGYDGIGGISTEGKVSYSTGECMDVWLSNVELMHTIAASKGIKFYYFIQPVLGSKQNKTKEEMANLLSATAYYANDTYMRIAEEFRQEVCHRKIEENYDYIFDLSHIFDDVSDVYLDEIHVKEKGNEIIAKEILQRLVSLKYVNLL